MRGERVAADRLGNAPDVLELHGEDRRTTAEGAAALAFLHAAVDDERDIAIAALDRHGRVGDMGLEGGAADIGGVGEAGKDAEIFAQGDRCQQTRARIAPHPRDQKPVDVAHGDARIVQGRLRGARLHLENGAAADHPPADERHIAHTHDDCFTRHDQDFLIGSKG